MLISKEDKIITRCIDNSGLEVSPTGFKNLNLIKKLIGTITSPTDTFKNILHKPRILAIFLVVALSQTVLLALRFDLFSQYTKAKLELAYDILIKKNNLNMTSQQIAQLIDKSPTQALLWMPFSSIMAWIASTLCIFILFKILKGKGRFKQYLCVTGYAYAPIIIGYVIIGLVSIVTKDLFIDAPITSLSFFTPEDTNPFIRGFIKNIELFTIWQYILIAIGLELTSKLRKDTACIAVGFCYLVSLLISGFNQYFLSYYT